MLKVARIGMAFSYMYDWEYGKEEQLQDASVEHLFVSFTDNLDLVEVRSVLGEAVVERFKSEWGDPIGVDCKSSDAPFDLPFDWVNEEGGLIAKFVSGVPVSSGS